MAQVQGSASKDTHPKRGKVKEVRQQWAVYEDGMMAHGMQEEEFDYKYGLNKYNRRTARGDVPVAKLVHSKEEERMQKEHMEHLERQKEVADRDAVVAQQILEDDKRRLHSERQNLIARANADAVLARRAFEEEQRRRAAEQLLHQHGPPSPDGIDEDAAIASQYQRELLLNDQDAELMHQEMQDEKIARQLQEKERKKYERRLREKELAKERKRLEQEQLRTQEVMLAGYRKDPGASGGVQQGMRDMNLSEGEKVLRHDGKVEDAGDFSDFYIKPAMTMPPEEQKELQQLQDEELARLLQDQEHKRGAKAVDQRKLQDIEARDAQLARVIYEQDKLKAKKKQRHPHGRQVSEPASRPHDHEHRAATKASTNQYHASRRASTNSEPVGQYYGHHGNTAGYRGSYSSVDKYNVYRGGYNQEKFSSLGKPTDYTRGYHGNRYDDVSQHNHGNGSGYHGNGNSYHGNGSGYNGNGNGYHGYRGYQGKHYKSADELDDYRSNQRASYNSCHGYHSTDRNLGYYSNSSNQGNPWWLEYQWRGAPHPQGAAVHGRSHSLPDGDHHQHQNQFNERVAENVNLSPLSENSYNSHYQERPLPARPGEMSEPQMVGRVHVGPEPQSPAPPGYRDPPSYPSSPDSEAHKRGNSQQAPPPSSRNMFTAIDPTYNQDRDPMMDPRPVESQPPLQNTPPHRTPPTDHGQPISASIPESATAAGGEDSYLDLDEVGPVQGQRRSTLTRGQKKGSKKSSCKQQ